MTADVSLVYFRPDLARMCMADLWIELKEISHK